MKSYDIGEIHSASVVEHEAEAVLAIKGTNGSVSVTVPDDMAYPFRDTIRELVRVYDDEAPKPGDDIDTLP